MQISSRGRATLALLAVVLWTGGCDSLGGPDPRPGELQGVLESPDGHEGGLVAELVGPEIEAIESVTGQVFTHARGDTTRMVLIRRVPGVIRFRARVPNVHDPPETHVLEVTDGSNEAPSNLSDYRVDWSPLDPEGNQ